MTRRHLLTLPLLSASLYANRANTRGIAFDKKLYERNAAQTIIIFLEGGASEILGNTTHLDEISSKKLSTVPYNLGRFTPTKSACWHEAGGDILQKYLSSGELTLFRTIFQRGNAPKSHPLNQKAYLHGNRDGIDSGIPSTLMHLLHAQGVLDAKALFSNVNMVNGGYYHTSDNGFLTPLPPHLKPITLQGGATNIFRQKQLPYEAQALHHLAQQMNAKSAMSAFFASREAIEHRLDEMMQSRLPSGIIYPVEPKYKTPTVDAVRLESAMRLLIENPQTKIVTMFGGFSGWDDHSNALHLHQKRARQLFEAIDVAMQHARAMKRDNINIVLFGDFGRNMNINPALGWDHGNNQNVYWFGGTRYLNHLGVVGETSLHQVGKRLLSRPAKNSVQFEPFSIAATIYALYGFKQTQALCSGFGSLHSSVTPFLKL